MIPASGRGRATQTGLGTRLLDMQGGSKKFAFDGTVFGLSLLCILRVAL